MTEDTDIRQLDEDTVARIAAGEVVERPASAVKELVENSLDAGASRIDVTVEAGGTDLVRVTDDGRGMTEADLRAAVRQHTTSKIESVADLDSGVSTLGFRGEALHTIGSVSRLTIRSRPRGEEVGTELVYEGGEVASVEPAGCPEGTTVEVADLFYNTPARRKFLKATATEFAHVNRVVTCYALANPDVAVSLTHDDREVFATTGQGDLVGSVLAVYGREVATAMVPVSAGDGTGDGGTGEDDDGEDHDGEGEAGEGQAAVDLPAGPLESVSGLVSHPETNRSSREYLSTYVNGRAVTSEAIREGIMTAYDGQLGDRYPFVVLFLEVPGDAVDVNVHPRKREVRFDDDDAVRRQVAAAVEAALLEHGLVRSAAPRGKSAPDEARIDPEREGGSRGSAANDGRDSSEADADSAVAGGDRDAARAERPSSSPATDSSASAAGGAGASSSSTPSEPRADATERGGAHERANARERDGVSSSTADGRSSRGSTGAGTDRDGSTRGTTLPSSEAGADPSDDPAPDATGDALEADRKFAGGTEQRTLEGEAVDDAPAFESLPPLRVLGQLRDTYLVCETPDGLALIDQHAADERVNYERLREAFASDPAAQALASPVELELTASEAEAFTHYREALSRLGFYADRVDDRTVAVTTVPAVLAETLDPERLRDVLASFVSGDGEAGAETVDALADAFLGDLACYPSITGNTSLTEGSVLELLEALDDCENPYACPHGRPVIVSIDADELEARFERDYPGHG